MGNNRFVAFFLVGLTFRYASDNFFVPVEDPLTLTSYLVLVLPLAAGLWYLVNLRLSVRVTDKNISVRYAPFGGKKHKIKWKDVEECEIISSNESSRMSGWEVNFDHERRYSLIGRRGLHLKTKSGDNILIGARNLIGLKQVVNQALG